MGKSHSRQQSPFFGQRPSMADLGRPAGFPVYIVFSWIGTGALREGRASLLFLFSVATLLTNALGHIGQALISGGYVPGVITAIIVCIPCSLYVFKRFRQAQYLSDCHRVIALVVTSVLL